MKHNQPAVPDQIFLESMFQLYEIQMCLCIKIKLLEVNCGCLPSYFIKLQFSNELSVTIDGIGSFKTAAECFNSIRCFVCESLMTGHQSTLEFIFYVSNKGKTIEVTITKHLGTKLRYEIMSMHLVVRLVGALRSRSTCTERERMKIDGKQGSDFR